MLCCQSAHSSTTSVGLVIGFDFGKREWFLRLTFAELQQKWTVWTSPTLGTLGSPKLIFFSQGFFLIHVNSIFTFLPPKTHQILEVFSPSFEPNFVFSRCLAPPRSPTNSQKAPRQAAPAPRRRSPWAKCWPWPCGNGGTQGVGRESEDFEAVMSGKNMKKYIKQYKIIPTNSLFMSIWLLLIQWDNQTRLSQTTGIYVQWFEPICWKRLWKRSILHAYSRVFLF